MTKRIYIVEDSEIIASIIKRVLELNPKYLVSIFTSTEDVIEAIHKNKPDLIITDFYLDDQLESMNNGAFLAEKIRAMNLEIILFLLSGKHDMNDERLQGNFNLILDKNDIDVIYSLEEKVTEYLNN